MSSPITSHGGGVLTASLKIPVQMQAAGITSTSSIHGQQNIQFFLEKPSNIGDNYTDLPYIEDNSSEFSDEGKNWHFLENHLTSFIQIFPLQFHEEMQPSNFPNANQSQ
jgi:hypothetical protein